jgi:hypothetical protein
MLKSRALFVSYPYLEPELAALSLSPSGLEPSNINPDYSASDYKSLV